MYNRINPSLLDVLVVDDTLPIDKEALGYWIANLKNPLRASVMHLCRFSATCILCLTYFFKRFVPIQFAAHNALQGTICWFMRWFVTPEANLLVLRHFWTESNLINFIISNSNQKNVELAKLYPKKIEDFMEQSFVQHDIVLMNALHDLGTCNDEPWPIPKEKLDFSTIRKIEINPDEHEKKWTQFLDFETAHELFKAMFCLLLTADEYERSINSLQFDHTLALRIARITGNPEIATMAYNTFPLFLVGPLRLSQRFVMHGLFTEHLNAYLEQLKEEVKSAHPA